MFNAMNSKSDIIFIYETIMTVIICTNKFDFPFLKISAKLIDFDLYINLFILKMPNLSLWINYTHSILRNYNKCADNHLKIFLTRCKYYRYYSKKKFRLLNILNDNSIIYFYLNTVLSTR